MEGEGVPPDPEEDEAADAECPAERSGHVAVTHAGVMYVWGGYKNPVLSSGPFDLYLPKPEVWLYQAESGRWQLRRSEGDVPNSTSGSCGACVDGVLYVFGGHEEHGNTNLVYRLPLTTPVLRWEKMRNLSGRPPSCKDKLGCWVHQNQLVYFGGYGNVAPPGHRGTFQLDPESLMDNQAERGWNNHIHILDLETRAWSQPLTTGPAPSPRAAHACTTVGSCGYVFGGRFLDQRLNDFFCLDLDTWVWSEIRVPGLAPLGRSWHSLTPVSSDRLFLFGGFTTNRETLSDAWLYCLRTSRWKPFHHQHTDQPRLWHSACADDDGQVLVFGGCANDLLSEQRSAHSNQLLLFRLQPKTLLRSCMEAAAHHRRLLEPVWDVLPKHLLQRLQSR